MVIALTACGARTELDSDRASDSQRPDGCVWDAPFDFVSPLESLNTADAEASQHLSLDELTIYFHGMGPLGDIFEATRTSRKAPFGEPSVVPNINSPLLDFSPFLSPDGLELYFGSYRTNEADIYVARRASSDDPFGEPAPVAEVNTSDFEGEPYFAPDGREFWFERRGGMGSEAQTDIFRAPMQLGKIGTPQPVHEINSDEWEGNPVVTADGLTLYFSRGDNPQIFVTHRASLEAPFEPATLVAELADGKVDTPSWISLDGCRLYFTSIRSDGAGNYDLYVAVRQ